MAANTGGMPPGEGLSRNEARHAESWVIHPSMWPEAGTREVIGQDGQIYLVRNEAMFTGLQHSQGEHSAFFLGLRDERSIFGNRCPSCRHIIVPPFMQRCSSCNFIPLVREYVKDVGVMVASPVITIFAPSRFKDQVPFGTGRVFLETRDGGLTDSAIMVRVRTSRGAIRPEIFRKGTPIKVVFCDERHGQMLDIFVLPQSELTPQQIAASPLMESEIEWNRGEETRFAEATPAVRSEFVAMLRGFRQLADKVSASKNAQHDLADWSRVVEIRAAGGSFQLAIADGALTVDEDATKSPDLVLRVNVQETVLGWLQDALAASERPRSPPLTDLVLDNVIQLSRNELETITRLDRLPRSLRRDAG